MVEERSGQIRWAPRLEKALIRRLYEQDARGITDGDLIDEVAYAFLVRCQDILVANEALSGQATCPRCEAKIAHSGRRSDVLKCACGWLSTWATYHASFKEHTRRLVGGSATVFFTEYIADFDKASTPRQRMLLIDRLINSWHGTLRSAYAADGATPTFVDQHGAEAEATANMSSACNLIEGRWRDILAFLDELSGVTPRVVVPRAAWDGHREGSAS